MSGAARVPESAKFVSTSRGEVSAALLMPDDVRAILAYGHGAGAGIHHPFMRETAQRLAARGIGSLRYHFPYMEEGRKAPDRPPVLIETVTAAVRRAGELGGGLPVFAGGKSMGGRMTSTASAEVGFEDVRGIVFFGFPLHAPNRPSSGRGAHLADTREPLLFLQGTRDALADLELLEPIVAELGSRATLHIVDGADHSFHVLKRSGRSDDGVLDELAGRVSVWVDRILAE